MRTIAHWANQLNTTGIVTIPATAYARKAITRALDAQGLTTTDPMRGATNGHCTELALYLDHGEILAVVGYTLSRLPGKDYTDTVWITSVRTLEGHRGNGYGRALIEHIAHHHHTGRCDMKVHGAVQSAKPFYAALGAHFTPGIALGSWDVAAVAALAAGHPIRRTAPNN